jgi:hypothetical protein
VCEILEFLLDKRDGRGSLGEFILVKLTENILNLSNIFLTKTILYSTKQTIERICEILSKLNDAELNKILACLIDNTATLICVQNGSNLFQKLLELLPNNGERLFDVLRVSANLVTNEHGYWTFLKAFAQMKTMPHHRLSLLESLIECMNNDKSKFANEKATTLLQVYIQLGSTDEKRLIVNLVLGNIAECACNKHGYYLIRKIYEKCEDDRSNLLKRILEVDLNLLTTEYGSMLALKWSNSSHNEQLIVECICLNIETYADNEYSLKLIRKLLLESEYDSGLRLLNSFLGSISILKSERGSSLVQNCLDKYFEVIHEFVKKNARELAMSEHGVWLVKKVYEKCNDVILLDEILTSGDGDAVEILTNQYSSRLFVQLLDINSEKNTSIILEKLMVLVSNNFVQVAISEHGFWIIRKLFDQLKKSNRSEVIEEKSLDHFLNLTSTRYGCYLVEYFLVNMTSMTNRTKMISLVLEHVELFVTKNVQLKIKILNICVEWEAIRFLEAVCVPVKNNDKRHLLVHQMARDQYGHHVVKHMLDEFDEKLRNQLILCLMSNRKLLKNDKYGRGVLIKVKRSSFLKRKHKHVGPFSRDSSDNDDDPKYVNLDIDDEKLYLNKREQKRLGKRNRKNKH